MQNQKAHSVFKNLYGNTSKHNKCRVCEEHGLVKYHKHYSTQHARNKLIKAGQTEWFCNSCKTSHKVAITGRHKIIGTSSTLHTAWVDPSFKPNRLHIDEISIPGAKFKEVADNVIMTYTEKSNPIDVAIISYLNDVKRTAIQEFERQVEEFIEKIKEHEKKHNVENTVAIVRLFKPPSLVRFPLDGPIPKEENQEFRNYNIKMNIMGNIIYNINKKHGKVRNCPSLENCGKRRVFKGGRNQDQHKMELFREELQTEKLHLNDKEKVNAYKRIEKYFLLNTRIEE